MTVPKVLWDWGTGYDFFVSLYILHNPDEFGLRPSWAAGVRSRLPAEDREILEQAHAVIHFPLCWVHALPDSKDSAAVLRALRELPAEERMPVLAKSSGLTDEALEILNAVATRGAWNPEDRDALKEIFKAHKSPHPAKTLEGILSIWTDLEAFGDRYLTALKTYREVFFAEEEERIRPALETALADAQELAAQATLSELIEKVSRGVRLEKGFDVEQLVLVPSYWITPLVVFNHLDENVELFLFGGRPDSASLVPGALVPDGMVRTLKTLADPTRLRILHFLSQETMSPAQLARRLRLRAPTVTHHLNALRLSGLVYLTLGEKKRKFYATRSEAIAATFSSLDEFLNGPAKEGLDTENGK